MSHLSVENLRCEYLNNPLGIGVTRPRLSWQLAAEGKGVNQAAYQIQVSKADETFASLHWDSGKVSSNQSIHITYEGPATESRTRYYYRVKVWEQGGSLSDWSETAYWETGIIKPEEWTADWITCDLAAHDRLPDASHMLRRSFVLSSNIKSARIYATALGLYELELNGTRVGDEQFAPGWTSYKTRLQTQTYDVTSQLHEGENALGALLGNGWYKGNLAWENQHDYYGKERALLVELHVCYENGESTVIRSDEAWKAETGPILMSEIYHGETYDARLERKDWSTAGYKDSAWLPVSLLDKDKSNLLPQENVPVRILHELSPVELIHTPAGETVLDFGQNMVGWVAFRIRGAEGSEVSLQHAEVLDHEGNFYIENLRAAKQTNRYTLSGNGEESYEPRFTFQGFRYVKLEGFPEDLSLDDFTGKVIYSDMENTGHFECSDERINQLQRNIVWGQRGNFLDVPTDCPQRDERLGWTGDAQVFIRTASFNMNSASFFTKWLRDLQADQFPDGGVPSVVPDVLPNSEAANSSAWGDAAVICPWTIYLCYGDVRILEDQYESMKAWVEYIRSQGSNEYLWNTGFHYGDWLGLDAKEGSYIGATPSDFIATSFFAYSAHLLSRAAEVLGFEQDAIHYQQLSKRVAEELNREFITPSGRLAAPNQTAHALALQFNLVEGAVKERVSATLAQMVADNGFHLTTGFVGTPYLCHALTQNGYNETAYRLVLQEEYPSWLYSVSKGATTIWEHWDGIKPDGSFWSKDMNSFNHYAYGAVGDWLYQVVAGIDLDEANPGYKHSIIHPRPTDGISFAKASLETLYGELSTDWKIEDGRFKLAVRIPHNTTATVILNGASFSELTEQGQAADQLDGVIDRKEHAEGVTLHLQSGTYSFEYPWQQQIKTQA
ncbi:alpha-L-rhamnosidase [Paenibacillus eucommiae]|uniref:alpha-L-rhamnosidase n=1 Tax=Paenibacillus eucommiae TaxID=1355755 RepID=A0ABS4INS2_9BACL|nr:alpha-L-rhamnosidase [Paenibacillus eucommiae]MBP1989217.1 alpha-L-rhamnosidase [Paenibacillus eucommiae]